LTELNNKEKKPEVVEDDWLKGMKAHNVDLQSIRFRFPSGVPLG